MSDHRVLLGDAEVALRQLAAEGVLVDTVVTSPPFWGLRDYGGWMMVRRWDPEGRGDPDLLASAFSTDSHKWRKRGARRRELELRVRASLHGGVECPDTGVRMDALGTEPTPDLYVRHLVLIFREVRRVLKDSGTVWLNLGDSYVSQPAGNTWESFRDASGLTNAANEVGRMRYEAAKRRPKPPSGFKLKDLVGIPWRVAFALQADGWWLRQRVVWAKGISGEACRPCPKCGHKAWHGSNMPESPKDRPTTSCEEVFLLSTKPHYWYDYWAVREEGACPAGTKGGKGSGQRRAEVGVNARPEEYAEYDGKRNWRSVWTISAKGTDYAHFAVFPPALVERCLLAGCPPKVCEECGEPWEHRVERTEQPDPSAKGSRFDMGKTGTGNGGDRTQPGERMLMADLGYHPACSCGGDLEPGDLEPGDLEMIKTPLGTQPGEDTTLTHGRRGFNRPRGEGSGVRAITRYEQRKYADQLRASPHKAEMEGEAGSAFAHYIRTDRSGARAIPPGLLAGWTERGWLQEVVVPETTEPPSIPGRALDPFAGSGTVAQTARKLGRRSIGVELQPAYEAVIRQRLGLDGMFSEVEFEHMSDR